MDSCALRIEDPLNTFVALRKDMENRDAGGRTRTTSIVREVHKAGVCKANCLQEEHTWQSESGARLEQTDGGLDNGYVFGIRQRRKISVNISTGRRWMLEGVNIRGRS